MTTTESESHRRRLSRLADEEWELPDTLTGSVKSTGLVIIVLIT